MRLITNILCFFGLAVNLVFGQSPFDRHFNKPTGLDTIYYPFYAGQQLIEVDHIGLWDREIYFLEQSQPRAMPHSMHYPSPLGNEYFVRDTTGRVLKVYNSLANLDTLTAKLPPVSDKSRIHYTHQLRQLVNRGVWAYSPQRGGHFGGYYPVYNQAHARRAFDGIPDASTKFGLIDTFGNLALPVDYQYVIPMGDAVLVEQGNKWGALDANLRPLIPIEYELIDFIDRNNKVSFKKDGLWVGYYDIQEKKFVLYPTGGYDEPVHTPLKTANPTATKKDSKLEYTYLNAKTTIAVSRHGLFGLVDSNYNVILPLEFELFEPQHHNSASVIRVCKSGKFGYIDTDGNTILPCEYDYINSIDKNGRLTALRDSQYTVFDLEGQKIDTFSKQLDWGVQGLGGGICLVWSTGRGHAKIYGVWDANTNKILMPIRSKRQPIHALQNSNFFVIYPESGDSTAIANFATGKKSEFKYKQIGYLDGHFIAKIGDFYGLIDTNFNEVLPFVHEGLHFCWTTQHHYIVRKGKKFGLINRTNHPILEPIYDNISCSTSGVIFSLDNKKGVIGFNRPYTTLQYKIPCEYDDIRELGSLKLGVMGEVPYGVWCVKKADKYGLINHKNQIILPILYDEIISLGYSRCKSGRCAEVRMGKNVYYVDYKK